MGITRARKELIVTWNTGMRGDCSPARALHALKTYWKTTMKLPLDFAFNQNNLQDYLDCPRRFQLRHVLRQSWPALVSEPLLVHEALMEQGRRFHTLAQQYLAGVPPEALAPGATDLELQAWWDNFLAFSTLLPEGTRRTEFTLQTSLDGFRILAKYDLLIASPDGRLYIFDWKTSRQRTRRSALQERVQTRLYPYLALKAAGHLLPEKTANAARIRMSYWFAAHPGRRKPSNTPRPGAGRRSVFTSLDA